MKIIDFRIRPLWNGYQNFVINGTTEKFLTAFRYAKPQSVLECSVEQLLCEMDEAGISMAVIPVRQTVKTFVSNREMLELVKRYPDRFLLFPLYDPNTPEKSMDEIKELVAEGCKGVSIEPGFGNQLLFDDEHYRPLYSYLNEHSLPLMATFSGSITPVLDPSLPSRFHKIAKEFPDITMIAGHGGWPWFREMCCMAFFTPNIYLVPDLYALRCPGWQDIQSAANTMLRDKILFGSSYPLTNIRELLNDIFALDLKSDSLQMLMYDNAARILHLSDK
ncbi:MAG: amidohydrolase family protein [Clostridiales bacterium]|nr:amidohydrolase family protein [Clostridiales bacterium]